MVFNPTADAVNTNLTLPLYYTGLSDIAQVSEQENPWKNYTLARDYHIEFTYITSTTWNNMVSY